MLSQHLLTFNSMKSPPMLEKHLSNQCIKGNFDYQRISVFSTAITLVSNERKAIIRCLLPCQNHHSENSRFIMYSKGGFTKNKFSHLAITSTFFEKFEYLRIEYITIISSYLLNFLTDAGLKSKAQSNYNSFIGNVLAYRDFRLWKLLHRCCASFFLLLCMSCKHGAVASHVASNMN